MEKVQQQIPRNTKTNFLTYNKTSLKPLPKILFQAFLHGGSGWF